MRRPLLSHRLVFSTLATALLSVNCVAVLADTISFTQEDFSLTSVFNDVSAFSFTIEIDGPLASGSYANPALTGLQYSVLGVLTEATPSGFPGFNLQRSIDGADFYAQGSSLSFVIADSADLSDGVQITEFVEFRFDGREVETGRYHPPLLVFDQSGVGSIRNSNNSGGTNPGSGLVVDVDFGDEYIVDLAFEPAIVPIPSAIWLFGCGLGLLGWIGRWPPAN